VGKEQTNHACERNSILKSAMQGIRIWQISHNETRNRKKKKSDLEVGISERKPGQVH
jgi:hypothetical protein